MTSSQEAAQILDAVEAMIARERERVDDPVTGVSGGDPSDGVGWRSLRGGDKRPGSPYYNADTWRWFQLVDLAYLDDLIVVEFRWTEPTTPTDLRYLLFCPADIEGSAATVAGVVRAQLRAQLAPGWRERLGHRWIGTDRVLLWRSDEITQKSRDDYRWSSVP